MLNTGDCVEYTAQLLAKAAELFAGDYPHLNTIMEGFGKISSKYDSRSGPWTTPVLTTVGPAFYSNAIITLGEVALFIYMVGAVGTAFWWMVQHPPPHAAEPWPCS